MSYDPISLCVAAVAGGLLWGAYASRRAVAFRLALILLAAFVIRFDAAWQWSLHMWDERYHALVAKHLIADPLAPTLYDRPLRPYDYRDWGANHVWLHKPPAALWLMAGSMRLFGVNELAMRLPSVLLSTAAILLTFLIARRAFDDGVGLLAAAFHAVNGFLVSLAAGRRVADHVDTALIFFIELGIWAALLCALDQRAPHRRMSVRALAMLAVSGAALGLAFLSKSLPALLIVPVALVLFVERETWTRACARIGAVVSIGAAVAAPWAIYVWSVHPREATWSAWYTVMHTSQTLEGQRSHAFGYVLDALRFFGELIWIPVIAAAIAAWHAPRPAELRAILVWALVPYATFSLMSMRLPGYVMIAAPALFIIQAWFWFRLRERLRAMRGGAARVAVAAILVALTLLPAKYLLEPTSVFERRDRNPPAFRELRGLAARLRLQDAVIFNMPRPIETMFYTPYTAYESLPTTDEVMRLTRQGIPVVIYQPEGTPVTIPSDWPVIRLSGSVR